LTFGEDLQPVKDWYNQQSHESSTVIKMMQLRTERVAPYHQFIVIQTQGERGRAYRVDRGRERDGWSFLDTMKKLGVPSRDTIAVLQPASEQPVDDLDKTSHCTIELHCSDDTTLDLSLILSICFRIHNNWASRYNLFVHNCYFFARTIINICDDKLNRESSILKSIWRRIFTTAYRLSAVPIWILACMLALTLLPLAPLRLTPGFLLGFGIGILLGPLMTLALLQILIAFAVRDMVGRVVKWERELELEDGGIQGLELERGRVPELDLESERIRALEIPRGWIQQEVQVKRQLRPTLIYISRLLLFGLATGIVPMAFLVMPSWRVASHESRRFGPGTGVVIGHLTGPYVVCAVWCYSFLDRRFRDSSRPSDADRGFRGA
jgi:hypothetical protein